jgi:hypothetical protein
MLTEKKENNYSLIRIRYILKWTKKQLKLILMVILMVKI